jgi:mono/diheme cytochrome c family protein
MVGRLHPGRHWRWGQALVWLLGVGALLACGSMVLPEPTVAQLTLAQAEEPALSLPDLQRGRALYIKRCASCHALRPPEERAPDAWPDEVTRMQREHGVRLTEDDKRDIVRYLRVSSALPANLARSY